MTADQKRRKLLFHIGHHKTGTTTIQNAFARKEVTLSGGRILYPGNLAHNYLTRHFKAYAQDGRLLPGRPGQPGLETIAERMQQGNFDIAVISGEAFEDFDPRQALEVLEKFMLPHFTDHAVICYVRPHAARILSSFAEQDKGGWLNGTPEAFFRKAETRGRFHYAPRLSLWADVFKDHFHLRPMVREELADGSLLQDFIATGFGPDAQVQTTSPGTANESLCLEDLVLLQVLHGHLKAQPLAIREALGWVLAEEFGLARRDEAAGTRLKLHRSLAEAIRAAYMDDATTLDTRFFDGRTLFRTELDRAVDEALPTAQSFDPGDHFSPDALVGISVLCTQIGRMLAHNPEQWPDVLRDLRVAAAHGTLAPLPTTKPKARKAGRKLARKPGKAKD